VGSSPKQSGKQEKEENESMKMQNANSVETFIGFRWIFPCSVICVAH
jgi:hypothetical protein